MKKLKFFTILLILIGGIANGQEKLSLDQCYGLLDKNYPLTQQKNLLTQQNTLDVSVINKGKLPQLDLSVKASYQSDVTAVPVDIPGVVIPSPNKDQYRATVTANQLLYNGGLIDAQTQAKNLETKVKKSSVDVALYQLRQRVNALFFSSLIIDEKRQILTDKKTQIKAKLNDLNNAVKYGTALASSKAILDAEVLTINQQVFEIDATKKALLKSLSKLIGTPVNPNVKLQKPLVLWQPKASLKRPELHYFDLQKKQIDQQSNILSKSNKPKIMAFAQGGYGNPGLNLFDKNFAGYYMVGLQLNWRIFDWQKTKKQRQSLKINQDIIDNQKEVFKLNTKLENLNQTAEIDAFKELVKTDKAIIPLREQVLKTAEAQLKNGLITTSDYLTELTHLYTSKTNLKTHTLQLEWAKINYLTTTGNYETSH